MQCAEAFLLELKDEGWRVDPITLRPGDRKAERILASSSIAVDSLAKAILEKLPELKPSFEAWWKDQREDLESAFKTATSADCWSDVSAHLRAASPFMLATHRRNLDKDCSHVSELKYAPTTSGLVESGFAHVDLCVSTLCGANIEACIGVAHAAMLKAFDTTGAKRAKAEVSVERKRKREGIEGKE